MSNCRLQCPHCGALFLLEPATTRGRLPCPTCRFDLLGSATNSWHLIRQRRTFGPYTWSQVKELSQREQLVASDVLTCEEKSAKLPLAKDESTPKARPASITISDGMGETLIPWASATNANLEQPECEFTVRFEDFQLMRKLGSGGMGAVYLAYQKSRRRKVAIKLPSAALTHIPDYVHRFLREAQILGTLQHPCIVEFLGAGEEKGVPFFTMEFIEGFATSDLLRVRKSPLPVGDALYITQRCADALGHAHGKGIIHRDIKPQNIMITALGRVKITDLGLAKPMQEDLSLTETGLTVGTPRFMAPEQARDAKHVDARTDIYALGGVLYYFLTGRAPYEEDTALNLLLAKERGLFPSPRRLNAEVPPRLCLILDRMLARDPRHRFQNCEELTEAIGTLELANEYLSFNPLAIMAELEFSGAHESGVLEILMVNTSDSDLEFTQSALAEVRIAHEITIKSNPLEALAYLNKQGRYSHASTPDLIVLGCDPDSPDTLELLREMQQKTELLKIPVVMLDSSRKSPGILERHELGVAVTIRKPEDMVHFEKLLQSFQGLCLTLVESPL